MLKAGCVSQSSRSEVLLRLSASFPSSKRGMKAMVTSPSSRQSYQNSCTHKTLTMPWLSCSAPAVWVNSSWWTERWNRGSPEALFANGAQQLLLSVSMQAPPGSVPDAAGTREGEESLKPSLTSVCQHLTALPVVRSDPVALAVTRACSLSLLHTLSNTTEFSASTEKLLSLAPGCPCCLAWLMKAGKQSSFNFS